MTTLQLDGDRYADRQGHGLDRDHGQGHGLGYGEVTGGGYGTGYRARYGTETGDGYIVHDRYHYGDRVQPFILTTHDALEALTFL